MPGPVYLTQASAPSAPPSNRIAVYAKTDGGIYAKTPDGTEVALSAAAAVSLNWPVGSIFLSVVSTNPATLLGVGTWVAFGTGRVPVGFDGADPNFNTVEGTGGESTHTLTTTEMPSHTHTQNSHNHTQDPHSHSFNVRAATNQVGSELGYTGTNRSTADGTTNTTATNQAATATNQNTGGDGAHNNLQPYIVVYMWKRTA